MRIYRAYQCPFFSKPAHSNSDRRLGVKCEAGEILFPDQKTSDDHKANFCANECGWRRCSIAITLQRYYDRKEGTDYGKS